MSNSECNQKNYRTALSQCTVKRKMRTFGGLHRKAKPDMYGGAFELNVDMAAFRAVYAEI